MASIVSNTTHPATYVVDFINCLPVVGLVCTIIRIRPIEGIANAILTNDQSAEESAVEARSLEMPKKIEILKEYRKTLTLSAISIVATIVFCAALKIFLPFMCLAGVGLIPFAAMTNHDIKKFIQENQASPA